MKLPAVLLVVWLSVAAAAEPQRNLGIAPGSADKRVALVMGNSAYKNSPLKNPVNDAKDMAAALRKLGFDVIERTDATQKEMNRAITQFGTKLTSDTVALFFYAGHGMQVKGKNYLVPIDAEIENEASVRAETVDVDAVLDQLAASSLNVVILDACRNNPFERRFRSTGGGLAQMDAPKGTLIAYATSPGKVASDGDGKNGLYTQELLKVIQAPGLEIEKAFKRVRANVARVTKDNQIPWEASSLTGDFFFRSGGSPSAGTSPTPLQSDAELEQEFWDNVKNSSNPEAIKSYLAQYPQGRFAAFAATKMASLRRDTRTESLVQPLRTIYLAVDSNLDGQSIYRHPICSYVRPVSSLMEESIRTLAHVHIPNVEFVVHGSGDAELSIKPIKMALAKAIDADSDLTNTMAGAVQVRLLRAGNALMTKTIESRSTSSKYSYGFTCSAWDQEIDAELKKVIDEMSNRLLIDVVKTVGAAG